MFRTTLGLLFASTTLSVALPTAAFAQNKPADETADASNYGEIVVTARREKENLQNIPVSVAAVSGDAIQKLNILTFGEVAKLAPGLTIANAAGPGTEPVIVLRGVRWTDASGSPAIPLYLNEISFDPATILQSMYDVQQIEVLRGPQGTTRGAPSISGAVTIATHRPDLDEFGGFASALAANHSHYNGQAAINVPVIRGKLAVRVAGLVEDSEGNRVRSLNNSADPSVKTRSFRVSVLAQPTDTLNIMATFQHTSVNNQLYNQVAGTGSPGKTVSALLPVAFGGLPPLVLPPNYNGPPISTNQYLSVQDLRVKANESKINLFTFNATWDVLGQQLNYNYGLQRNHGRGITNNDVGNSLIGFDPVSINNPTRGPFLYTHELRLSSVHNADRFFDYNVGIYYSKAGSKGPVTFDQIAAYVPGAFGAPIIAPASPYINQAAISRYSVPIHLDIDLTQKTYSFYGNLQFHLPYDIELSGGVRFVDDTRPINTTGTTGASVVAFPNFLPAAFGGCPAPAFLPASPIYGTKFCDAPIPGSVPNLGPPYKKKFTPVLYNISISKKLSSNILIYATTGSSYRTGVGNIATYVSNPNLLVANPEYAKSYEFGFKSTLFDRKVRFNADVFQINYKDQLTQAPNVQYLDVVSNPAKPVVKSTSRAFFQNLDARVRGIEVELAVTPMSGMSLSSNLSYAKIESKGGLFPCNDPTRPLTANNVMNFCAAAKGQTVNAAAPFQANISGSYTKPLMDSVDGYVRFLINHNGKNPNFGFVRPAKAYTLVDLFAGISRDDGGWDLGFYAKNVFDRHVELTRSVITPPVADFGPTGYDQVRATLPREIGVTLRYAFGSR